MMEQTGDWRMPVQAGYLYVPVRLQERHRLDGETPITAQAIGPALQIYFESPRGDLVIRVPFQREKRPRFSDAHDRNLGTNGIFIERWEDELALVETADGPTAPAEVERP